jgi:hypothetical protein
MADGMPDATVTTCPWCHATISANASSCPRCLKALRTPWGAPVQPGPGVQRSPGLSNSMRSSPRSATRTGRAWERFHGLPIWTQFVLGGATLLLLLAVIVAIVHANPGGATSSISYRDGYATGQAIVNTGSAENGSVFLGPASGNASQDCQEASVNVNIEGGTFSVIPNGDNPSQWMEGCTAGYNEAEYRSEHPGASSAPPPSWFRAARP